MRERERTSNVLGALRAGPGFTSSAEASRRDQQGGNLLKGSRVKGGRGRKRNSCRGNWLIQQLSSNQNSRTHWRCVLARRVLRASYVSGTAEDHLPRPAPVWAPAGRIYVQYSWEVRHAQFHVSAPAVTSSAALGGPAFHRRLRLTFANHDKHRCVASSEALGTADRLEEKQRQKVFFEEGATMRTVSFRAAAI